jgi:hypothetical protein
MKRSGVLAGFIPEPEMARELGCTPRTLARWRTARTGPPFVMRGRAIEYSVDAARDWLRAGGTGAAAKKRKK